MTVDIKGKECAFNPKNKPGEKIGTCQGEEHYEVSDTPKRDQKVNNYLSKNKIRVIRFWEHDVIYNSENILKFIKKIM